MSARVPVPEWVSWSDLAAALGKSPRQIKRDAAQVGARLFYAGTYSKGVIREDVNRLYSIRRAG